MRIVFIGTARFACPSLEALARRHDVSLVVTQPDRPAGRKRHLREPPVKAAARKLELPVDQPEKINARESIERLRGVSPEAIVVAAYGQILKERLFTIAPLGTINIHASLLPAYRGAAPIPWAIVRGEKVTGITTFRIDRGMDTGDILLRRAIEIEPEETAAELESRLANLAASAILETLDGVRSGTMTPSPQPDEGVSYAPMLKREDGRIDWTRPALEVHNLVRGLNPWPGAWTKLREERVKVHRSRRSGIRVGTITPGEIALGETGRLLVACGDEFLDLLEVQRQGRPSTSGAAFLHGIHGANRFV